MSEQYEVTRHNRIGLKFTIREINHKEVIVLTGNKGFMMKATMLRMLSGWYRWMMLNQYIQEAFDFLNSDEREFLQSGLLPDEWTAIFPTPPEELE